MVRPGASDSDRGPAGPGFVRGGRYAPERSHGVADLSRARTGGPRAVAACHRDLEPRSGGAMEGRAGGFAYPDRRGSGYGVVGAALDPDRRAEEPVEYRNLAV